MIEDLDQGGRSVTNDIHRVVQTICTEHNLNPVEHYIIYKDSMDFWDGYVYSTCQFIPLRQQHWLKAATKYINQNNESD